MRARMGWILARKPKIRYRKGFMACRVCGCTQIEPCNPPCAWAGDDERGDLCSTCELTIGVVEEWKEQALRPSMTALLRETRGHR